MMMIQGSVLQKQCHPPTQGVACRAGPLRRRAALAKASHASTRSPPSEKSWPSHRMQKDMRFPKRLGVQVSASPSPEPGTDNVEIELKIGGMMCEGCTSRVTEALQKCESVAHVEVSLEKGSAAVWVHSPSQLEALSLAPALAEAVKAIGFEAKPHIDGL